MSDVPAPLESADDWLTSQEVADWLKVPLRTVESWRARKVGPTARKVGRAVRYLRSDVTQWILSGNAELGAAGQEPLIRAPRSRRRS